MVIISIIISISPSSYSTFTQTKRAAHLLTYFGGRDELAYACTQGLNFHRFNNALTFIQSMKIMIKLKMNKTHISMKQDQDQNTPSDRCCSPLVLLFWSSLLAAKNPTAAAMLLSTACSSWFVAMYLGRCDDPRRVYMCISCLGTLIFDHHGWAASDTP